VRRFFVKTAEIRKLKYVPNANPDFLQRMARMTQKTKTRKKRIKPQRALRAVLLVEDLTRIEDGIWATNSIQKIDLGKVIWDFSTEEKFQRAKGRTIATELLPIFVDMINARSQDLSYCVDSCVDFPGWMYRAVPE